MTLSQGTSIKVFTIRGRVVQLHQKEAQSRTPSSGSHPHYVDFFGRWKDADPGIPILKEAKAEYAKLQ